MPPSLHYKTFGTGEPLVILHGLFGGWDNWYPVAKALSGRFGVYVVDQRNHGQSFHSDRFDYEVMAQDLRVFMDQRRLAAAALLGHSMGAKTAMRFAALFPERVRQLIVVDITHRSTGGVPAAAIEALRRLDLVALARLKDADDLLQPAVPDVGLRRFLLKNLDRTPDGRFRWKVHLEAIRRNLPLICGPVEVRMFSKPSLFIRGADSPYIADADWPEIRRFYPQAQLVAIPGSGHWPHVDNQPAFLQAVADFLDRP
jgi:pimeloyl-ACP methyl ester carboxylesterase